MSPTNPPQNIYAPPQNPEPAPPPQKANPAGKWLAIIGACMQVGIPIGLIWTETSMRHAFSSLGSSGIGDRERLSVAIGDTLIATAIGLSVGIIGVMLIAVSVLVFRYRTPWIFWFSIIISILFLLVIPIGTIMGIVILIYSITHRNEFLAPSAPAAPPQPPT